MKKYFLFLTCVACLLSCAKKEDWFDPNRVQDEAKKNFPVQDVDPEHDWDMSMVATISVALNQGTGETYTIKVYNADPFDKTAKAALLSKGSLQDGKSMNLTFDMPKALEYVYVVREDTKYNRSMKPVKVMDGKGEVKFGQAADKRSLAARSAVAGVTYPDALTETAIEAAFKTPSAKELKEMTSFDQDKLWGANSSVTTYKLDGKNKEKDINLGGKSGLALYITTDVELKSLALGTSTKIYVLNGAKLSLSSFAMQDAAMLVVHKGGEFHVDKSLTVSNASIYNRGEITTKTGSALVQMNGNAYLYNDGVFLDDNKATLELSNATSFFLNASNGEVDADNLSLKGGATFINESGGDVEIKNTTSINGNWVNDGSYKTFKFTYTGQNYLVRNDCRLVVEAEFYMHTASGAKFLMNGSSTMHCKQMSLDQATIELGAKAFIKVENNIHYKDGNKIIGTGSENALLYVEQNGVANGNSNKPVIYDGQLKVAAGHNNFIPELQGNADLVSKEQIKISEKEEGCSTDFETEGGGSEPVDPINVYTYAFEDSSTEGGDYDFNDVVLKIETVPTNGKLKVKLVAAGAAKDLKVFFADTPLFGGKEVHEVMGCAPGTLINTGKGVTGEIVEDEIPWPNAYTLSKNGNFYIFDVKAQLPVRTPKFDSNFKKGNVPYAVIVPIDWSFPSESQRVDNKYPRFVDWAKDATQDLDWYITK